jgi:hypothetical protein
MSIPLDWLPITLDRSSSEWVLRACALAQIGFYALCASLKCDLARCCRSWSIEARERHKIGDSPSGRSVPSAPTATRSPK